MNFFGLRPSAPTAAATAEALERARTVQAEAGVAAETAKQSRDGLLLDGEPAPLAAAEKALVAARADVERAAAVVAQLEGRLVVARHTETLDQVEAARTVATTAWANFTRWTEDKVPQLLAMIEDGKRLQREAENAQHQWDWRHRDAEQQHGEIEGRPTSPTNEALEWRERAHRATAS